jgi:AraC family transcriptional regulator
MTQRDQTVSDYAARIVRVLRHLSAHPGRSVTLQELADVACFSPFHFHRIYRAMLGETVAETLARERLSLAAADLLRTARPVAGVARRAGYGSAAAFTRAFRAAYGTPPAAYRAAGGIGAVISHPGEEETMQPVTIRELPPLRLAVLDHRGPYTEIGGAFARLGAWAAGRGVMRPDMRYFGMYHDDPTSVPPAALRSLAAVTVPATEAGDATVRIMESSPMRVAVLRYRGPYGEIEGAYTSLFRDWLPDSGEEPAEHPCIEEYLNDPKTTPQAELLTDILVPLKARVTA